MKHINLTDGEIKQLKSIIDKPMYQTKEIMSIIKKLTKQKIKSSSCKQKGRALQHFVCERLSEVTGIPYNQSDDNCEIHSREMGQKGLDIVLRGMAAKLLPFSIECKNVEKFNIRETIDQVKANKKEGTDWVIVYKHNGMKSPAIVIDWEFFERCVKLNILDDSLTMENLK